MLSHHTFLLYQYTSSAFSELFTPSLPPSSPPAMASLDQQLQEALAAINSLTQQVESLTINLNALQMENQNCVVCNNPHLFRLYICHNPPWFTQCRISGEILWLSKCYHNTLHLDLWALAHYWFHHDFLHHTSLSLNYHQSNLSKIQRSHHPFFFLANKKMLKHSFTCVFFILMDVLQNLEQNKTRLSGFSPTCKPDQHKHGESTSWLKFLRKCYGMKLLMMSHFLASYHDMHSHEVVGAFLCWGLHPQQLVWSAASAGIVLLSSYWAVSIELESWVFLDRLGLRPPTMVGYPLLWETGSPLESIQPCGL